MLRARTVDANGNEQGTFTANTRPTDTQVTALLGLAADDVQVEIGPTIASAWWPRAKRVVTLGAALLVELSYFPEQVASGRSPYAQLKELYDARLKALTIGLAESAEGGDEGASDDMMPSYAFHEDRGGLVGWQTDW